MPTRRALVVLIAAATAALVVGVALERDARTHEALRTSGEAAAVWRGAAARLLAVVALVMAAFAALDVREVVHQIDESRTGLTLLALLVAALHLAAAALAARAAVSARRAAAPRAGAM